MAPTTEDIQKLQKQLDDAQTSLNEALRQLSNQAEPRSPRRTSNTHPSPINEDDESIGSPFRSKFRRGSVDSRKTGHSTVVDGVRQRITSVDYSDATSDSDEGESFFAAEPLPLEDLDESGLREHLEAYNFNDHSSLILRDLFESHRYQNNTSLFEGYAEDDEEDHDAQHHDADVYEVDKDGSPRPKIREESKKSGDHSQLWEVLRHTNTDKTTTQKAVGRIVVMREPTSLLCAALHYTMNEHFDMDSIFKMMIDDKMNTKAYVKGHLSKDDRHQRSIVFMLKYHTLVGKGRTPLLWQNHDDEIERKEGVHVPISTCSAIVALSLSGKPALQVRSGSRKSRKRNNVSTLFDPFNPWHVLSIQCYPDWHADANVHETKHHYVNGPDAFLATLLAEYRDAVKRFRELSTAVVDLASPPKEVVFNADLRDDLLFEHGDFKWSRRYFWASQVLQILSEEIRAMIAAYEETFTGEFWRGEHKTLFVGTADVSARYNNFRKKIAHTRKGFQKEIDTLRQVLAKCNADQKHIRMLREWLFSGTSVLESRSARKQDYNIKLLTLVTIIFLPLMFVTSVFGMTNINENENFIRFGYVVVCIAVPTYWMIVLISYHEKLHPLKNAILQRYNKLLGKTKADTPIKSYKTKDQRRLRPIQKSATNSNLQRRLTSLSVSSSHAQSLGSGAVELNEVSAGKTDTPVQKTVRRPSKIRFGEPFLPNGRRSTSIMAADPSPNDSDAEQIRLPERARTSEDGTQRRGSRPRRKSLLQMVSSGHAGESDKGSPV